MSDATAADRPAIDAVRVAAAVGGRWQVSVVDQTASTNADLLADVDAPERSVLVAEYQSAGRGRLDRGWVSVPRAGLTFSVLLRPVPPIASWGWLPLLAGVALHDAVTAFLPVPVALKWPNDLLVGQPLLKAAGILAQTSGDAVVIGIGVNVTTTAEELPVESATSLVASGGVDIDRTDLLIEVLRCLHGRYLTWTQAAGDAESCGLAPAYRLACATIGQFVAVSPNDAPALRGKAVGIDSVGRLIVDVDGTERVVGAGDVAHLRPA